MILQTMARKVSGETLRIFDKGTAFSNLDLYTYLRFQVAPTLH